MALEEIAVTVWLNLPWIRCTLKEFCGRVLWGGKTPTGAFAVVLDPENPRFAWVEWFSPGSALKPQTLKRSLNLMRLFDIDYVCAYTKHSDDPKVSARLCEWAGMQAVGDGSVYAIKNSKTPPGVLSKTPIGTLAS